jgi:hypothetical protein
MNPDYIWSLLKPQDMATCPAPPSIYTLSSFTQRVDFTHVFVVDDTVLQGEKVLSSVGLYSWFVNRGVHSVVRYGIVPNGAVSVSQSTPTGNGLSLEPINPTFPSILWVQTAVPYSVRSVKNDQVAFAPDAAKVFSQARTIAGSMIVMCDTSSISDIVGIRGSLSGATFTDVRTIQQVLETVSSSYQAYDSDQMMQNSATTKDQVNQVSASNGIIAICGPDISPFMTVPNAGSLNTLNGNINTYVGNGFLSNALPLGYSPPFSESGLMSTAWITPWHCRVDWGGPAVNTGVVGQNIFYEDGINPGGVLDIEVFCEIQPWAAGGLLEVPPIIIYNIHFVHVFSTVNHDGSLEFYTYGEQMIMTPPAPTTVAQRTIARTSARPYHSGIHAGFDSHSSVPPSSNHTVPTGGLYVGTQVSTYCFNTSGYPGAGPYGTIGGLSFITYRVTARTVYVLGEIGPVRIMKYENLSNGSQISMRGMIHVQGTPFGTVAPFVTTDPTGAAGELDLSLVPKVARMFDGSNTPLRRMWSYVDYRKFIALGKPTQSIVDHWLRNDQAELDNRRRERPVQADTPTTGNMRIIMSDRLKNMDTHLYTTQGQEGERSFVRRVSRKFNETS